MQSLGRSLLCLVLTLLASTMLTSAQSHPSPPEVRVPRGVRGEAAIAALGNQLAVVAARYGKTTNQLAKTLRQDKELRLDEHGNLFYACEGIAVPAGAKGVTSAGAQVTSQVAPLSQTFLLHSKPGSSKIIYLDFNGYTITNTAWNSSYNNGAPIVAPAWDIDGDPTTFGTAEQTAIQQIWQRVAEDYAPFDVDVTTEDPGEAALTCSSSSDKNYGVRALISPIGYLLGNPGGTAYVGVFNAVGNNYKPALIFPENLANNEKYIGEAISHEVGHTLGLSHDGDNTTEYYAGQGNWAPIMGVSYYQPISQWSKGEYTNANNTQDDLAVITSYGLSYRSNDFGGTRATAKALTGTLISTNGIIAHTGESDYASFQTDNGVVQINVTPWDRGADLHMTVTLYDSSGAIVTNCEPADDVDGVHAAIISRTLTAGTYYVAVTGKGSGNPLTNGYSSYASLGQYTLNLTLPSPGMWLPVTAGNYSWTNTANWLGGVVPNAAGVVVKVTNNISGSQTVTLDSVVTLGQLLLGATNSASGFLVRNGSNGSLKFDVPSGPALIQKTGSGADEIASSIMLVDQLVVSNGTAGSLKISGAISGTNDLVKTGPGLLTLSGTNLFTGGVTVSNGVLALDATGSLACPKVEVKTGARFDVSTQSGNYSLGTGQILGGNGVVVGGLTVNGTLTPGSSIGSLSITGAVTLAAGGQLVCEMNSTNNVPGVNNDYFTSGGALIIAATSSARFTVRPVAPALTGWNNQKNYTWTLATAGGGVSGFAANKFTVDTSSFTNNLGSGSFSIGVSSNALQLNYVATTVPVQIASANFAVGSAFHIVSTGVAGNPYSLWSATNLTAPINWQFVASTNADDNGAIAFADAAATNAPQKFYRLSSP